MIVCVWECSFKRKREEREEKETSCKEFAKDRNKERWYEKERDRVFVVYRVRLRL